MTKVMLAAVALLFTTSFVCAASWLPVGPPGGPVFDLDRSLSDPDVLMVAAEDGIYRSEDRGRTWVRASGDLPRAEIIRLDPLDPKTAYASRLTGRDAAGGGLIYKTIDGGNHWIELGGLPPEIRPTGILIDPRNPLILHVAGDCYGWYPVQPGAGVFTSVDGGVNWARAEFSGPTAPCAKSLALDPRSPDYLYATPGRRSLDGGRTWQSWTGPLPGGEVVTDRVDPRRRYGTGPGPFVISEDGGATWAQFTPGGILPYASPIARVLDGDPVTGRLFLGTDLGLYRSGDGGRQWAPIEGAGRESVVDLSVDPRDGSVILATEGGVYVSEGFPWNDWDELEIGHRTRRVQVLRHAPAPGGDLYALFFGSGTIYRSGDSGATWTPAGPPVPSSDDPVTRARIMEVAVSRYGDLFVIAYEVAESPLGNRNRLFLLRAGSNEWVVIDPPPIPLNASALSICCVAVDPRSSTVYVGQSRRIVRSADYGQSWEILDLPSGLGPGPVLINGTDSSILLVSSAAGVLRSVDGGASWVLTGVVADPRVSIVESPADSRVLYLWGTAPAPSQEYRLYRSLDAGATWEERGSGPVGSGFEKFTSMVADPRNSQVLYVATLLDGVFRSSDGGVNWQSLGAAFPRPFENSPVWYSSRAITLAVDPRGGFLFAAMPDRDIWRLPLISRGRPAVRR